MLDRKNPYTSFGQMLVSIGILNLIARADIILDVIISFVFIAKGGSLIRNRKWPHDLNWNRYLTIIGTIFPILKLVWIYFFIADITILNSTTPISKADVMFSSCCFLVPASVISVAAIFKLKKIAEDTV